MNKFAVLSRLSMVLVLACAGPLAAHAQNIATVNGKPIPKARFDTLLTQIKAQGQPPTPDLELQVKDELVLREMFSQEAERRGMASSPDFKAQMDMARQGILISTLFADYQKKNPVTDAEVTAEYEKFKAESKSGGGTQYRARHILVEKEDEAKSLISQINKGTAKFEDLAKKSSKDPGSKDKGGDLDFADPKGYVPEFSAALMKLKKGEMTSTPVKSEFGYHIIKLEDTREAQFPPMDAVRPQIEQRLSQQRLAQFREEIRAKTKTDYVFNFEKNKAPEATKK
ncbi:MAG: peptidylprolyl isomerase [Pseudomonadota bacterium]